MSDEEESDGLGERVAYGRAAQAGTTVPPLETWGLPLLLCLGNFSPSLTVLGVHYTTTQKRERTP